MNDVGLKNRKEHKVLRNKPSGKVSLQRCHVKYSLMTRPGFQRKQSSWVAISRNDESALSAVLNHA